ncbi:hypothetical protein TRICI_006261 [Trichomonascus ciferrii]|uniref:ditrans,polycis-polyprenyl diphosphate synthase [(2E,6E)-farnesyldiphosphate specific] n=1 Tax=Trichomonascus ciferrii TaxID=44093 RepID=A0A642UJD3_9ASCO|nr:hypothetical protein TRICI_006261 [Trichomonascus ciferrii]
MNENGEFRRSSTRQPFKGRRKKSPGGWGRQRRRERVDFNFYLQKAIVTGDENEYLREAAEGATIEDQQEVYNVLWRMYDSVATQGEGRDIVFDLITLIQNVVTSIMGVWEALVTSGQRTVDAFVNTVIFVYFTLIYTVQALFILNPFFARTVGYFQTSISTVIGYFGGNLGLVLGAFSNLQTFNQESLIKFVSGVGNFIPTSLLSALTTFQNQWNFTSDVTTENSQSLSSIFDLTLEYLSVVDPQLRVILPYALSMVAGYFQVDQDTTYNTLDGLHQAWNTIYAIPNQLYAMLGMPDTTTASLISLEYNYAIWFIDRLYQYLGFGLLGGVLNFIGLRMPDLTFPKTTIESSNDGNTDPGVDYTSTDITQAVRNLQYIPDHVAIVLQMKPYNPSENGAPALTFVRSSLVRRVQNRMSRKTKEEIERQTIERQMLIEEQRRVSYEEQERARVIRCAVDAIVWCLIAGIPCLTLYEQSGVLEREHRRINQHVINSLNAIDSNDLAWDRSLPIVLHSPHIHKVTSFDRSGLQQHMASIPPETSFNGLTVSLISQNENNAQSVVKVARQVSLQVQRGLVRVDELSDESLSSRVLKTMTGISTMPGLLILSESNDSTTGFPLYALKMTLV